MILLIDAGNTRIKWSLTTPSAEPGQWLAAGSFPQDAADKLAAVLHAHPGITQVLGTNVAGAGIGSRLDAQLHSAGLQARWLTAGEHCCGVRNGYREPAQLGADRWAALIGARHLHSGPALVVSAGTATTADLLDAAGLFHGGLILPGLDLMLRALAHNTAQLPLADGQFATTPDNTADAIMSGCLQAQAGAIERMFAQIAALPDALCLLGGGAADRFASLLRLPLRRVDNLVLIGLAALAQRSPEGATIG